MYVVTEYQYQLLRNYCKDYVVKEIGRQPLKEESQTIIQQLKRILIEIISVKTSLDMTPSPIKDAKKDSYLRESDEWAKHAYEHAEKCRSIINNIMEEYGR